MNRTLVLFPGALGDFLCLWPALRTLREERAASITLAIKPDLFDLVNAESHRLVSIDAREIADLFGRTPLRADTRRLFGGHTRTHSFIGAADEGFTKRLREATGGTVAFHHVRGMGPGEHATRYFARCLGVVPRAHGLKPGEAAARWAADLWRTANLGEHALAIHAGSGSPTKNWLGMAEIAHRWREGGGRVVLLTGPAEREEEPTIANDAMVREESLSRVAAVLQRAERYAGNDSGISHLAGLVAARGAVVFGPSHPATWRPNGTTLTVLTGPTSCTACGTDVFCTHRLAVDEVWRALARP